MSLQRTTLGRSLTSHLDAEHIALILAFAVALILVVATIAGVHGAGTYVITPDPAAGLGLPF